MVMYGMHSAAKQNPMDLAIQYPLIRLTGPAKRLRRSVISFDRRRRQQQRGGSQLRRAYPRPL
eukprot:3617577-Amphidinium_carterae.1